MDIVNTHRFAGDVIGLEMGRGVVGPPLMTVYCYLVGDSLIDCGQSRMSRAMAAFVERHRIERLLLTHHHEDHSGNASLVSRRCGAGVHGHSVTVEKMQAVGPILPYQHLIWGQARNVTVAPLPPMVDAGRFRFLPIHTPGHSRDHTVYLETGRGWLFSGDLYLGDRIQFFRSDERIDQQIRSLKLVLQYDFDVLFCAHHPVGRNAKVHLARKLDFLESVCAAVSHFKKRGYSRRSIVRRMANGRDRWVKLITMGNASFANLIRSAYKSC